MKMEGAPIGDYMDNPTELNYLSTIASSTLLNSMEPVSVHQKSYEESIQVKELLLDALQGREIIPIDNKEYKNEEIDKIVTKIETFSTEFHLLQKELDGLHDQYNKEVVKTTDNIRKIESSIQLMKKMEDEYQTDDMVKAIVDNLNDYSKKIQDNDKLSDRKQEYIQKRKELNSYLYFIQKLNRWNIFAICPICITEKIDSYCNPCGHTACRKCLERSSSIGSNFNQNKCPICREYVMDIRKLYFI